MEELLKALRLIKDTCNGHESCRKCPMAATSSAYCNTYEKCALDEKMPAGWNLVEKASGVRLFKDIGEV